MNVKMIHLMIVALATVAATSAAAQNCSIADVGETPKGQRTAVADKNFQCLMSKFGALEKALASEKARADQLEATLATVRPSPALPRGAVVAFDRDDLSADKCPEGWTPFDRGRGRMIVGAGNPASAPEKFGFGEDGKSLSNRDHRQHGGSETHVILQRELPSQVLLHGMWFDESAAEQRFGVKSESDHPYARVLAVEESAIGKLDGGQVPHNNMPPYVALYFCKKEAG